MPELSLVSDRFQASLYSIKSFIFDTYKPSKNMAFVWGSKASFLWVGYFRPKQGSKAAPFTGNRVLAAGRSRAA
ncbi:hypothetical protein ACN38_g12271 [Penicillium nordicum]|uniref:Uncharacterized protein n=1 Tax=Penicillium nordicum TaxID=229535 RepID=A0A0M9WA70_9EURO|nr:hypothetical protein ACN38_g12271 [Penicillium nordicum]